MAIQFTHFSVEEFLSLATSSVVASYHVRSQSDQRMSTAKPVLFILDHLTSLRIRFAVKSVLESIASRPTRIPE